MTKCNQVNGIKNVIMQVTYFLNVLMVNLLFCCHVFTEGVFLKKFTHNFTLEVQTFQKMLQKVTIIKFETFYEVKTTSGRKKIIQHLPTKQKLSTSLEQKFPSRDLQEYSRHLLSKCFENAVFGYLCMVQMGQCKCFI